MPQPSIAPLWIRLALKELRETLRDRRTILTLVLMPLLLYPLLGLTFQKFVLAQFAAQKPHQFHVALETEADAQTLLQLYFEGNKLLGFETTAQEGASEPETPPLSEIVSGTAQSPTSGLGLLYPQDGRPLQLDRAVEDGTADLGIRLTKDDHGNYDFAFVTREKSSLSESARQHVERRLRAINDRYVRQLLSASNEPRRLPCAWTDTPIISKEAQGFSLATLVPLVLILMTVTGAVYPAIDLTAGERERGTLEALIAAPISRRQVLGAKYIAVVTVALMTAVVNLVAMVGTAYGTGLEAALFGSAGLSFRLILQIFGLLAIFAGFFSAVILMLTSIARSFKEAQAYLIPLMLVSLAPGILALLPGLEMTPLLALVPLANMVLLTRDLLDGQAHSGLAMITLVSTAASTALALSLAARIFGTDAVLYGSSGTWSDLWQRPEQPRPTPTITQAWVALGVLFPSFVLLGSVPARLTDWPLGARLAVSASITVLLFAVWPMVMAWQTRCRVRTSFALRPANLWTFLGAAILGGSLWPFAYELEVLTISPERLKFLVELFRGFEAELRAVPLPWRIATLAIVPAVCEEFFFRGYLFQAFLSARRPFVAILVTGTLFALFHVLVRDALLFERFPPTFFLGISLGLIAWRTRSVLPGILLHVIHNSVQLSFLDISIPDSGGSEESSLPAWQLLLALSCVLLGAWLVRHGSRQSFGSADQTDAAT